MRATHDDDGYGQYCPIVRAAEVIGERWTLLIVRDLLCGATRFNDLARGLPGLSRSLLSKRLRQLEAAGVVTHVEGEYLLTESGRDLHGAVFGLGAWAARWQFGDPRASELDPELLLWWVHRRIDWSVLPDRQVVLAFRFVGERRRFWIVHNSMGPSICMTDPGFEVDVLVEADLSTLYQVWLGRLDLRHALHTGSVRFTGIPAVVRKMPSAMLLSEAAELVAGAQRT